jgi:predicted ATPase
MSNVPLFIYVIICGITGNWLRQKLFVEVLIRTLLMSAVEKFHVEVNEVHFQLSKVAVFALPVGYVV